MPDGRAAMSQGMIDTARRQARAIAPMLRRYLDEGRKIVVLEPSVLAMLRFDFKHLLDGDGTQALLAQNSFEPLEYLWQVAQEQGLDLAQLFPASRVRTGRGCSITRIASSGPAMRRRKPSTCCAPRASTSSPRRSNAAAWPAASATSASITN